MVGDLLKKAREESGKDLRKISETLKIRYDYLQALEEEEFKKLPEEVYIKGYIREYAELLKIDPHTVIDAYIKQTSALKVEKEDNASHETKSKKLNSRYPLFLIPLFLIIVILLILAPSQEKPELSQPPQNTMHITKSAIVNTYNHTQRLTSEKKLLSLLDNKVNKQPSPHILTISANDTSWVFIIIDDNVKKEMLLTPGDSVTLKAKNGFRLKIGNAGGIRLTFDEEKIEKLGDKGQVVKLNLPK